ncbi:MAG: cobalt-precorrin-6A reductase [Rhodococcus sp. (in: high G+C Gram-positive bacteria)]
MRVLILGGTAEARALAQRLTSDGRFEVVSSLAGRVARPQLPAGESRVGGFGGAEGLAAWIEENETEVVVDATHPFAAAMSAHASTAASTRGVALVRLHRREWAPSAGDEWVPARSTSDAAHLLENSFERAFLTIGRQGVGAFAHASSTWFLIRSIDPPTGPLPRMHELLSARGPFEVEDEITTMQHHRIDVLVSKNSGGVMTEAKLVAARRLDIPVIMIARPPSPPCDAVAHSVDEVAAWLCQPQAVRSRPARATGIRPTPGTDAK